MRAWDFLFLFTVLAPALTGGIWQRDGFHFRWEYTQPGIAALVLAGALWWAKRRGVAVERRSMVCRLGLRFWAWWREGLERRPLKFLIPAWLLVSVIWFLTSLIRHRGFGSGLADLAIFTNGIWNVGEQGYPYSSIKDGLSLLADHQIFLLYPLGWLFKLWPSASFLLLLQAFALASGGVALYLLARQRTGAAASLAAFLPLAFWLGAPVRNVNRFDFHPETLMLPLFLFAAFFLQEKRTSRRLLGFALLVLALGAKESAGPVACGLGLAWMLGAGPEPTRRFTRLFGAWAAVLGFLFFYADSQLVPKLFGRVYSYSDLYAPFGASPSALLKAPFVSPLEFFGRLFSISRIKFFLGTALPFAGLPLFSPLFFLSSAPGFLMLFLTNGDHRISLSYHYVVEPLVGLLFVVPAALCSGLVKRFEKPLLAALVLGTAVSFGRSDVFFWRIYQIDSHKAWLRDEVLPLVDRSKVVAASYALTPHLAARRWIHQLPVLLDEKKAQVDCVVWERTVSNTGMGLMDEASLAATLKMWDYTKELSCGSLAIYRRKDSSPCLVREPGSCVEGP